MKTRKFTIISIFTAIIIVLQVISTYINFGSFPITLTLIPIIIAGAVYGPSLGTIMGAVFGTIVSIMVIIGADPSGAIMFSYNPIATIAACLLKGILSGLFGALAYKYIKNHKLGIIISSIITPITNTFILYLFLILFFDSSFTAMVTAFMSINFIIELAINIILAPSLLNLINRAKSRNN